MSDHVKRLPAGVAPAEVRSWPVTAAEQWRDAVPRGVLAPGPGAWTLAAATGVFWVMTWHDVTALPSSTVWSVYGEVVLLGLLPLWYRYLPGAAALAAAVLPVNSLLFLITYDTTAEDRVRHLLELAVAVYAFTGAWTRLRARRRQRTLFRSAAGAATHPLPAQSALAGRRRYAMWWALSGGGLCLIAAALLLYGLNRDLAAHGTDSPYNAFNEQGYALVCLMAGTPLLGRGVGVWWALRRLASGSRPVLVIGVRVSEVGFHWLYPNAVTTTAGPLAARSRWSTGRTWGRQPLVGGAEESLRKAHRDVDARREPYEALLYGEAYEGAEILLRSAVYNQAGNRIVSDYVVAGLLPNRPPQARPWHPAVGSHRLDVRASQAAEREKRAERERTGSTGGGCGGCGNSCGGCGD
ncbi:hypothetical protein HUT18_33070 [Streptomyces sp. NA04227]|uniref:hypothetical protein n=1 Tax=Streptomyces sp. NA04227 TaxID=2742136 RepID=UPI0015904E3B|nr:hypothetical protein [Streptomyces sp. NA04227]QKW10533.1 hypothetical protein HUT18_33070 [Streptomyces sp. NA04227]